MSNELVLSTVEGDIARLTLNDPSRANVLSTAMMSALQAALAGAVSDPKVKVIVIAAAGRLFCAGHDLGELRSTDDIAAHQVLFGQCGDLMQAIVASPKPVIAAVQGAAVAAGCQLVASCDLAYAADSVKFAVSGVNLGLFCSTPGVALGRAIGRKAASEMLLTGAFIDAGRAVELGLINRAVPAADLAATVDAAAAAIAGKAPEAIALGKSVFNRQMEQPLDQAYATAARAMADNLAFQSAKAGIDGFLRK